jgi:hypothetical protein
LTVRAAVVPGRKVAAVNAMAERYRHVTAVLRQDVAKRLDAFIWNDK